MGRKNKSYYKDLHQQAYDRLNGMQAFGESKKEAIANGTDRGKIFSFNTYQTYWKHTKYFFEIHQGNPSGVHDTEKREKIRERVVAAAHGSGAFRVDDPDRSKGTEQALRYPAG